MMEGIVIVGLAICLTHARYRAGKAEDHYRKLCLVGTAITMAHGKANGTVVELTAPAEIPNCDLQFITQIVAGDHVCMRVELNPGDLHRKREPLPVELDEDMVAALA